MQFPIFYGFIAPDIANTKPLTAIVPAVDLATKLDAQLSVAIGAMRLSVPTLLSSGTVEGLVAQ